LALWLGLVGCLWRTGRSPLTPLQRTTLYGLTATLAGYFAYGLFDTIALGARPGFIFWTLVGLVLGLHGVAPQADVAADRRRYPMASDGVQDEDRSQPSGISEHP
ncbi:MAG: hypothetical protein KDE34_06840, partial [Anaerolineales bacterium]|nr:hypothetical protein [Anaerolineales bacterium]